MKSIMAQIHRVNDAHLGLAMAIWKMVLKLVWTRSLAQLSPL